MLANPKRGERVVVHYRTKPAGGMPAPAEWMPYHGRHGEITIVSRGKPRNHGVRLDDGTETVIPCGNLYREKRITTGR